MINPEHNRKALREQLDILSNQCSQVRDEDLPYEFLRDHSLAIVQLCNQLIDARSSANNKSAAPSDPDRRFI